MAEAPEVATSGQPAAALPSTAYAGRVVAFGTVHGKELQVAPAFAAVLDAEVVTPPGIDTDQFGTFSGETARTLSPIDAARAKARLAMTALATPYGLASEASYGPLPGLGLPGHEELLIFLDVERDIEVVEGERTLSTPGGRCCVTSLSEAQPFLNHVDFPAQAIIVRAASADRLSIHKGITDLRQLEQAIQAASRQSANGQALLEPDLRAHHNPTRRALLTRLGHRLAQRLATACPACSTPGYGRIATSTGLPCSACDWPTDLVCADIHGCQRCHHQHRRPRRDTSAEPRWCDRCNP